MTEAKKSPLELVEERRAARKAKLQAASDEQRAKDLEAIDLLEVEYGDSNIATLEIPFTEGLPILLAVRTPQPMAIKRYRDTVKPKKNGDMGDNLVAALQLAAVCLVYPDKDTYQQLLEARPGIDAQLGVLAVKLAAGKAAEEGKD